MLGDPTSELQELIDLTINSPSPDASFRAILILLRQAPDSSVIVNAMKQIDPSIISDQNLRKTAAQLLASADEQDMSQHWMPAEPSEPETNVIPLATGSGAPPPPVSTGITFDDIGGLEPVKKQVRRKIINPFQGKRALFERFKRQAGGGVLMYGPPGCGKTMLARALASECNAHFFNIRASDILDQLVGNAEKRIANLFSEARAARPAVLFFDEIEALAQRRQFESSARVNTTVSALLTEMDGFQEQSNGLLFLGATNVPWSLDSAFRRPGRFDRTIFVPPPDRVARAFILRNLLQDRPVSESLDLDAIVEKSTGFSGADLNALLDTAIDIAIEESPSVDALEPLSNAHFDEAFRETKSSVGEWLGQAKSFAEYANEGGMYDELAAFLKKYGR